MGANLSKKKGPIADINVTPLVDVMLVLLVIFMITAPLMLNGIQLQLPKTQEVNPMQVQASQIVLSLTLNNEIFLGKDLVEKKDLLSLIKSEQKKKKTQAVFIRADYTSAYGQVAKLMSFLKQGGINSISLITEIEQGE